MKKTITVDIDGKKIPVSKLPLGKYAELLKAVKELPKHLLKFKDLEASQALTVLPQLIGESYPDFVEILTIATPLTKEEVDAIGLDDAVSLVLAVIEVNNFKDVYSKIKKVIARPATEK